MEKILLELGKSDVLIHGGEKTSLTVIDHTARRVYLADVSASPARAIQAAITDVLAGGYTDER